MNGGKSMDVGSPWSGAFRKLRNPRQSLSFAKANMISRMRQAVVGKNVEALLVNTRQGCFVAAPEDLGVGGVLIDTGAYGEDEIDRIRSLTDEQSGILFVGANIGALAIPASKKVKRVTAVEANPNTFKLLAWNILLNNCGNITSIPIAASDRQGELEFVLSHVNSGGSKRMPKIKEDMYFFDKPDIVMLKADRLDDVLSEDFDLIVMDIEGSEYFALKGMQRTLSKAAHLIVEFLPHHLKNVANVSVREFLSPIDPHFQVLTVPTKSLRVEKAQFGPVLESMYQKEEWDEGIVFSKS